VLNPGSAVWRHHVVREFDEHSRLTNIVVPGRTVQVADSVDVRWLMEDMFAKIRAFHRARTTSELRAGGGPR